MNLLKNIAKAVVIYIFLLTRLEALNICLTGKVEKNLPSYGQSFENAVKLAKLESMAASKVNIKSYFYNNNPLEPLRAYEAMKNDDCAVIIGYEYLTDLLLVSKIQLPTAIPIFTSYASTLCEEKLPKNIFIFMPCYEFLTSKMLGFLKEKFGQLKNVLVITEIGREDMQRYKKAYESYLSRAHIEYDKWDYLENTSDINIKLDRFVLSKKYDYIILLSGAIAASKIANDLNNHKTIFVGTDNFGSSSSSTFFRMLNDKHINAYFIRNLDFLKNDKNLFEFRYKYQQKYNSNPTILSVYAYDAASIALKTLAKKGDTATSSILSTVYNGVTGVSIKRNIFKRSNKYVILSISPNGYVYEE